MCLQFYYVVHTNTHIDILWKWYINIQTPNSLKWFLNQIDQMSLTILCTLLSLYTLSNACRYMYAPVLYTPLWTWNGWIAMGSAIYDMMLKI